MISENANIITDIIYKMYGTDSGVLFGITPSLKESVRAIVEAAIFIYKHDEDKDDET